MHFRSVIISISIAMLLMVAGIGNAFASTYSGIDWSKIQSGPSVSWSGTISQTLSSYEGDILTWYNVWQNSGGPSCIPQAQYGGSPSGVATGGEFDSGFTLVNGQYYPTQNGQIVPYALTSRVLTDDSGTYSELVNHIFKVGTIRYGTGYTDGTKFTI